ncbi:MAG TPA: ABC transporter ATP-binding protein [Syntrophorhabdales bacterium]|nr:ABC transporter ATP-binding protein [Syntrophorhabdales bacterium]
MKTLLETRKLTKFFGGLAAVHEVDFQVRESEIVGLIGPNGAGKSTFFNLISGFHPVTTGTILFQERDITGVKAHKIASLGIARAFQAATLFMELSVFDNVFNGLHGHYHEPAWKAFLHLSSVRKEEQGARERVREIIDFMGLADHADRKARNLPHGHQKILGVCIAMATAPKLLLLDEPFTGMHPEETAVMIRVVEKIRDSGVTIVIVEHNMEAVMRLCDRIAVLNQGRKIAEAEPQEIAHNPEVIEAYLGSDEEEL